MALLPDINFVIYSLTGGTSTARPYKRRIVGPYDPTGVLADARPVNGETYDSATEGWIALASFPAIEVVDPTDDASVTQETTFTVNTTVANDGTSTTGASGTNGNAALATRQDAVRAVLRKWASDYAWTQQMDAKITVATYNSFALWLALLASIPTSATYATTWGTTPENVLTATEVATVPTIVASKLTLAQQFAPFSQNDRADDPWTQIISTGSSGGTTPLSWTDIAAVNNSALPAPYVATPLFGKPWSWNGAAVSGSPITYDLMQLSTDAQIVKIECHNGDYRTGDTVGRTRAELSATSANAWAASAGERWISFCHIPLQLASNINWTTLMQQFDTGFNNPSLKWEDSGVYTEINVAGNSGTTRTQTDAYRGTRLEVGKRYHHVWRIKANGTGGNTLNDGVAELDWWVNGVLTCSLRAVSIGSGTSPSAYEKIGLYTDTNGTMTDAEVIILNYESASGTNALQARIATPLSVPTAISNNYPKGNAPVGTALIGTTSGTSYGGGGGDAVGGGGSNTAVITYPTGVTGMTGTNVLQVATGGARVEGTKRVPFDPTRLYKVTARVRRVSTGSSPGYMALGVQMLDGDGNRIAQDGTLGPSTLYVMTGSSGVLQSGVSTSFVTYVGYIKGESALGALNGRTMVSPSTMHTNCAAILPCALFNFTSSGLTAGLASGGSTMQLDYVDIEVVDLNPVDVINTGVVGDLKSSNYAAGVTGWKLGASGVEFNTGVTVNGNLVVNGTIIRGKFGSRATYDWMQDVQLGPFNANAVAGAVTTNTLDFGAVGRGNIWIIGWVFEAKNVSSANYTVVRVQFRSANLGNAFGPWTDFQAYNDSQGLFTTSYGMYTSTQTISGYHDDLEVRIIYGNVTTTATAVLRNVYLTAVRLTISEAA